MNRTVKTLAVLGLAYYLWKKYGTPNPNDVTNSMPAGAMTTENVAALPVGSAAIVLTGQIKPTLSTFSGA